MFGDQIPPGPGDEPSTPEAVGQAGRLMIQFAIGQTRLLTRAAVALAFNVATNHNMTFKLTAIPDSYPYSGPLDFRAAAMRSLFDFAENCASRGLLWKTPQDVYEIADRTNSHSNGDSSPSCPGQAAANN